MKNLAQAEQKRLREQFFQPKGGTETIAGLRAELNQAMESGAGIYRNEDSLRNTCTHLKDLNKRFCNIELADHSLTFNTELTAALELEYLLDVAEAVATVLSCEPNHEVLTNVRISPYVTTRNSSNIPWCTTLKAIIHASNI